MRIAIVAGSVFIATSALASGYKQETVSGLPDGLPQTMQAILAKEGTKIVAADGKVFCELWFRTTPPPATQRPPDETITMTGVEHGAFLGIIRFPAKGADRRGQPIEAGLYTLRLSFFPQNGDHQGVAPQRDFLLLSPLALDQDPAATPDFETLTKLSMKASGTPHPAVLSMWKEEANFQPGLTQMGDTDWVLRTKIAGIPVAIIVIGKAEG